MTTMANLNQSLLAGRGVTMVTWAAADGSSATGTGRHHAVHAPISVAYEVKPSFQASTRRLTEGSS